MELGLPNKLITGHRLNLSYFSKAVYESGLGLTSTSKQFDLQGTLFNSLTIFWAHIIFQA